MKIALRHILLLSMLVLLVQCSKDDVTSRVFPRLKTLPVTEITDEGARLNAEIIYRGDFEILRYGFVWGERSDPNIDGDSRVIRMDNIQTNTFSEVIDSDLKVGETYNVRAFVETANFIVYGANETFVSMGSKAPKIVSFSPLTGTWGDTIAIVGENFSFDRENLTVKMGELTADVIASTDTTISILVPAEKNNDIVSLQVTIFGNSTISDEEFSYLIPEVSDIFPLNVTFGDTVTVSGMNFGSITEWNRITLDDINCVVTAATTTEINFVVPSTLEKKSNPIEIVSVGRQMNTGLSLDLNSPEIFSFSPLRATRPNEVITIFGDNFNPEELNNLVKIGEHTAAVLHASSDTLKVELPNEIVPIFEVSVFDTLNLEISVGEQSVSAGEQLEVYWYSTWTKRNDFPGEARHNAVAFAIDGYGYLGSGATQYGLYEETVHKDFWRYDPQIDEWTRISDLPGPPRAGASAFAIDDLGYVGLGTDKYRSLNFGETREYFNDFYMYNGQMDQWIEVASLDDYGRYSAGSFSHGSRGYIVTGDTDDPEEQPSVTSEAWEYNPTLDNWKEIKSFPYYSSVAVGFEVNNEGYVYAYNRLHVFRDNDWVQLTAPELRAWDNIAFGIGEFAYFGLGFPHYDGGTNELHQYNVMTGESALRSLPTGEERWGAAVFVINNKAYIIGGATGRDVTFKDMWEFNPSKPD